MRTLVESLFDKDLAQKDITIGEVYEIDNILLTDYKYDHTGRSFASSHEEYTWLSLLIKLSKLKKKFAPVELDRRKFIDELCGYPDKYKHKGWVPDQKFVNDLSYLIAAIYSAPIAYCSDSKTLNNESIKDAILPYLKYFKTTQPQNYIKTRLLNKFNDDQEISIRSGYSNDCYKTLTIFLKKKQ